MQQWTSSDALEPAISRRQVPSGGGQGRQHTTLCSNHCKRSKSVQTVHVASGPAQASLKAAEAQAEHCWLGIVY